MYRKNCKITNLFTIVLLVPCFMATDVAASLGSEKTYSFNNAGNYIESDVDATDIEQSLAQLQLNFVENNIPGDTYPSKYAISGDFNNDNTIDIFSALWSPKLYLGDGIGAFAPSSFPERAFNAVSADFNNDGHLDIYTVAFGAMQQNYVYLNNGNGTFNASIIPGDIGGATYSASAGDFNNDGNMDLYVTNLSMGGSVGLNKFYLGDGTGAFTEQVLQSDFYNSTDSAVADFNNDGNLDLYVTGFDFNGNGNTNVNSNKVYLGDGQGSFPTSFGHGYLLQSFAVAAADFNNDGNVDVYIANGPNQDELYLGDGYGNFISTFLPQVNGFSKDVISKDFNNDGNMDLYLACNGQNKLFFGDGLAGFVAKDIPGNLGQSHGTTSADFNNDGLLDIYVSNDGIVPGSNPWAYEQNKLYLSQYSDSRPYVQSIDPFNFTTPIKSFSEVLGPNNEGEVVYQLSLDNGATWKYYQAGAWLTTTQTNGSEANSAQEINSTSLYWLANSGSVIWRAYLISDSTQKVEIEKVVISNKIKHKVPPKLPRL